MNQECDPDALFLGPKSENMDWLKGEVLKILDHWKEWRNEQFVEDPGFSFSKERQLTKDKVQHYTQVLMEQLENEIPSFSPRYVSHMMSELSLPALLGHLSMVFQNPNNISTEVSKVGSFLEEDSISMLLEMVGYDKVTGNGHFTSGGTVANLESLWRARYALDHWLSLGAFLKTQGLTEKSLFQLAHQGWTNFFEFQKKNQTSEDVYEEFSLVTGNPLRTARAFQAIFGHPYDGPVILVPKNKHYSWQKSLSLMGFGGEAFWSIELNEEAKLCTKDLKLKIEKAKKENRPILMVVSVVGTTELGEMDDVGQVQQVLDDYRDKEDIYIWHHVDAAYGGYYCSLLHGDPTGGLLNSRALDSLKAIRRVDSVTLDPHKLGYVPYSCGALLVKDKQQYEVTSFAAPYLISSTRREKWSKTLEGSRSAAGAAATWLSSKVIGLNSQGYGKLLNIGLQSKINLEKQLYAIPDLKIIEDTDTNIICFCIHKSGDSISTVNRRSLELYNRFNSEGSFYVSKTSLGFKDYTRFLNLFTKKWQTEMDASYLTFLRIVLMNPFISRNEGYFEKAFVSKLQEYMS